MIVAVGDVHGQYTMLCDLLQQLEKMPLAPDDRLIFLGDYIDRGENSCAVIEKLLQLYEQRPNTIFLRGNHEQLMLDALASEPPIEAATPGSVMLANETLLWFQNGGIETLLSYQSNIETPELLHWWDLVPEEHWDFMRNTRPEFLSDFYYFVHAGLLPQGKTWEYDANGLDPRLWIREPFLSSRADFGRIVVFGHTPQKKGRPLLKRNKVGIDTGAVFSGPLTAAAFDDSNPGRRGPMPKLIQAEYTAGEPVGR